MKKIRAYLLTVILLLAFILYFILKIYPTMGEDFDYYHIAITVSVENSNHINSTTANPGFYLITIFLVKICNIPVDITPLLPILLIPSFIFYIIILRRLTKNKLIYLMIPIILITKVGSMPLWYPHSVGEILWLLVIFLVIFRGETQTKNQMIASSLILIIAIIAENYISYKLTFLMLAFIVSIEMIDRLNRLNKHTSSSRRMRLQYIALIGIVFTLAFNIVIYKHFLPRMRFLSDVYSSGIGKLILPFNLDKNDPLSEYYFRTPLEIRYLNTIWLIVIFISLFICITILNHKFIKKISFSLGEKTFFALMLSSCFIFIIYIILGYPEIYYLVFSGLVGFTIIIKCRKNIRKIVTISILILLALNFYGHAYSISNDFHFGQRDQNYFQYMEPASNWYIKYGTNLTTATDVFTYGYIWTELAKGNMSLPKKLSEYTRGEVLYLLGNRNVDSKDIDYLFIINYREQSFYIRNWDRLDSWSNYRLIIETHPNLNTVYSSGDIVIYANHYLV